jgi:hypothetical protein
MKMINAYEDRLHDQMKLNGSTFEVEYAFLRECLMRNFVVFLYRSDALAEFPPRIFRNTAEFDHWMERRIRERSEIMGRYTVI